MIRLLFFITGFALLMACSDSNISESSTSFNLLVNDTIKIDQQAKYFEVMAAGLRLNEKQDKSIRSILGEFRKKRKGVDNAALAQLIEVRERKLREVLSPVQMELRRFVHAKYNGINSKDKFHPSNIQKDLGVSDGQMLKLLEVMKLYEINEDASLRDERLFGLLGKGKADKYLHKLASN